MFNAPFGLFIIYYYTPSALAGSTLFPTIPTMVKSKPKAPGGVASRTRGKDKSTRLDTTFDTTQQATSKPPSEVSTYFETGDQTTTGNTSGRGNASDPPFKSTTLANAITVPLSNRFTMLEDPGRPTMASQHQSGVESRSMDTLAPGKGRAHPLPVVREPANVTRVNPSPCSSPHLRYPLLPALIRFGRCPWTKKKHATATWSLCAVPYATSGNFK